MRLIDADKLENYAYEPEFGIKDEIENWVDEINIPVNLKVEYEEELRELCWKVLKSCMNVIKTEPTAYDVDKVVERMEALRQNEIKIICKPKSHIEEMQACRAHNVLKDAIKIVKSGGIE